MVGLCVEWFILSYHTEYFFDMQNKEKEITIFMFFCLFQNIFPL